MKITDRKPDLIKIADLVIGNTHMDIRAKGRQTDMIKARWLYTKLSRAYTLHGTALIGSEINKDHSTILSYFDRIRNTNYFTRDVQFLYQEYAKQLEKENPTMKPIIRKELKEKEMKLTELVESYEYKIRKLIMQSKTYKGTLKKQVELRKYYSNRYQQEKIKTLKLEAEILELKMKK